MDWGSANSNCKSMDDLNDHRSSKKTFSVPIGLGLGILMGERVSGERGGELAGEKCMGVL